MGTVMAFAIVTGDGMLLTKNGNKELRDGMMICIFNFHFNHVFILSLT